MRFIDPQTDFAFKKIFGSEQSKPILISFLNALVYQGQPKIKSLEIIDPYQAGKVAGLKDTYLDVKAVLDDDTKVIIEMQCAYLPGFEQRILYNTAKDYANQLLIGQRYEELNPVIALTITKFSLFANIPEIISYFEFKERNHLVNYPYGDITMIFVELSKFQKELEDLANITDKWIYFMKKAGSLEIVPEKLGEITEIKQAFAIANEASLTRDEWDKTQKQESYRLDQERLREKAQEAEQKAQEAEQKAQEAEEKAQEAEQKAQEAEQKAQQQAQEAERKLQEEREISAQQLQEERERLTQLEQQLQQEKERKKNVILRQLSRTIGEIEPEIQSKIDNLSSEQLESLFEVFLDFENISDLINWLQ